MSGEDYSMRLVSPPHRSPPMTLKLVWVICIWLLLGGVVLTTYEPSNGYEPSLYMAVVPTTWFLLGGCAFLAIYSTIWSATDSRESTTNAWIVSLCIVIAVSTTIIFMPILRGYAGYGRSDLMIHVGRVIDIISHHHIPKYDRPSSVLLYPAPTIILSQISLVTGVAPFTVAQFSSVAIYILGIIFTFMLARLVLGHPLAVSICMLTGSVLLLSSFNYEVLPTAMGFSLFPMYLWMYLRAISNQSISFRLIFILLASFVVFVHPITGFNLVLGLFITEVFRGFKKSNIFQSRLLLKINLKIFNDLVLGTVLILFITLITWLMYNYFFWELTVRQIILLITELGEGAYSKSIEQVNKVNLSLAEAVGLLLKIHGHHFIYLFLAATGGLAIIRGKFNSIGKTVVNKLELIIVFLATQVLVLVSILFGGTSVFGYWRVLAPIILLSPILLGIIGYRVFFSRNNKNLLFFRIGYAGLLFFVYCQGMFSFFPSPYTYRLNSQISNTELQGMKWFIKYRNESIAVDSVTLKYVFGSALNGYKTVDKLLSASYKKWGETLNFPDHFDYLLPRKSSEIFPSYYLPIHKYDQYYRTIIPWKPPRLLDSDFYNLNHKYYANHIYSNGELDIWIIYK